MTASCLLFGFIGLIASDAVTFRPVPAEGSQDAKRPYEMVWANRRAETPAPIDRLESAEGWRAEATNGEARVSTADDRLVFGDGVMRFDYCGTGKNPVAKALRNQPLALPPFDTFSVWIYGNNFYGNPKDTPITQVFAEFADADGKPFSLHVTTVVHREWCKFIVKVPEGLRTQTKAGGWKHLGFRVTGGTNPDFKRLDFTSFCAYVETFGPLAYKSRAKRGVQIFKDQDQGVNTGFGHLPFPTTERTVIPPCEKEDPALEFRFPAKDGVWDDLAFRVKGGAWIALSQGGGVWPRTAADRAQATFRRVGNSVVADVVVKGGDVEEMRFGTLGVPTNAVNVTIPFYRWGSNYGWERPRVVVAETEDGPRFIGCVMDWTQSNASEPYMPRTKEPGIASFGGALYKTKTDGKRNDVYERFVWTVSPTFEGTLPTIPNPVSPWRHVTGRTCWIANPSQPDRATNIAHWTAMTRKGIRRMTVTDHEVGWRDGMESYTFRTNSAPKKGGDPNWYAYTRKMIDGFGFYYGPYNNFTDITPVNEHWSPDHILRHPDGSYCDTWSRCWSPKPLYGLEMCEKFTPIIAAKFGFNTAYCDVHTAVTPWSRTDYDWRVPGAGTMTQTFYAYGEIMLIQKRCWQGPVSSEGGNQWFYAGIVDQNYGQDCPYRLDKNPWIVDFELLRAHPLGSDHGMGYSGMLWGDRNVPKDVWEILRTWYPATLAFGHAAFLLPEHPSYAYYMTLAIASRYSQENVRSIRYADAVGKLYTTSEAILSGVYKDSRIVIDYDGGTHVEVNLHGKGSVFARGGDTVVFSGVKDGAFGDFCRGGAEAGYVYVNGRGKRFTTPGGSAACELIRLAEKDGTEEVIPADNPKAEGERLNEVGLPYAAKRIVALGTDKAEDRGEIAFRTDANGWTWFTPRTGDYSYRVTLPDGYAEPSADDYEAWCRDAYDPGPLDELVPRPRSVVKRGGVVDSSALANVCVVRGVVEGAPADVADQAYMLEIGRDGVRITASGAAGERYAWTTLEQLRKLADKQVKVKGEGEQGNDNSFIHHSSLVTHHSNSIPYCRIVDWPVLKWRGYMNDCGRNYLAVEGVKAIIDTMAKYKMNLFHWHLSDYHGWRLESKRYPQLQKREAFRRQIGKYYTQDEFREIVAYAAARGVTVMPELDVPGHSLALRTGLGIDSMKAEGTDKIVSDLFEELCSLAPADVMPFIHLGTDEVRTKPEFCDESWPTKWVKTINAQGRRAVVWAPGKKIDAGCDVIDMAWYDNHITNAVNDVFDSARVYNTSWGPFDVLPHAAYTKMCRWHVREGRQLGAITCTWHDDNVGDDTLKLFRECMVFPVIVAMGDNFWTGREADEPALQNRLPAPDDPRFAAAADLERRIIAQRDKVLKDLGQPFPFLRQTDRRWRLTDAETGKVIAKDVAQGSVWLWHFQRKDTSLIPAGEGHVVAETWVWSPRDIDCGAWIDFMNLNGVYGRLDHSCTPKTNTWDNYGSSISLNGVTLPPPAWKNPGAKSKTSPIREQDIPYSTDLLEVPLVDEMPTLRAPYPIRLGAGWNHVKLDLPKPKGVWGRFWLGTFAPFRGSSEHPVEIPGLIWSAEDPQRGK